MLLRSILKVFSILRPKFSIQQTFGHPAINAGNRNIFCLSILSLSHRSVTENINESGNHRFNYTKANLILTLNFKNAEDALPFYKLPIKTLYHIQKITADDKRNGFCDNRLYYIASRLKYPSAMLSEKLSKRSFVYSLSFDWLEKSLDVLLDMGVSSERIVRDLWVLKYHHETIRDRLQRIKAMKIDTLYPWMVRCSPDILSRYINLNREAKCILGDTKSTQMYLAERLNISIEEVEKLCLRMRALKTIRVTKLKKFLDYLIDEGYAVDDIASKPRILSSSQRTVHQRLQQLRQLGLNNVNLNILCRSRKDYKKFYESLRKHNASD